MDLVKERLLAITERHPRRIGPLKGTVILGTAKREGVGGKSITGKKHARQSLPSPRNVDPYKSILTNTRYPQRLEGKSS